MLSSGTTDSITEVDNDTISNHHTPLHHPLHARSSIFQYVILAIFIDGGKLLTVLMTAATPLIYLWSAVPVCLQDVQHDQPRDAGFSLLELVVAVSIMLILGSVGFVSYQTYTDNARQANVDSEASQVLTAAVAADNTPGDDINTAVREYNKSSAEISANITEATADSLTITATDKNGTVGTATISGNYGNVETTAFSEPGVTYAWVGEPGRSASIKYKDGQEVARNSFSNPKYEVGMQGNPGDMREYERHGRTGEHVINGDEITINTTLDGQQNDPSLGLGPERYGIVFVRDRGWNEGDVIRAKVHGDLAPGHNFVMYADYYNTSHSIESTTSARFHSYEDEIVHTLEANTVPDTAYMVLLFWIEKHPNTEPGASTATISDIYIGPADHDYFNGDSV